MVFERRLTRHCNRHAKLPAWRRKIGKSRRFIGVKESRRLIQFCLCFDHERLVLKRFLAVIRGKFSNVGRIVVPSNPIQAVVSGRILLGKNSSHIRYEIFAHKNRRDKGIMPRPPIQGDSSGSGSLISKLTFAGLARKNNCQLYMVPLITYGVEAFVPFNPDIHNPTKKTSIDERDVL